MALLKKQGDQAIVIEDRYARIADDEPIPSSGAILVSLDRFLGEKDELSKRSDDLGIWLRSEQSPLDIETDLSGIKLVALDFPVFSDGRAYSSARILRERMGFEGELRAIGDVLCEQLTFMIRSGFDTFEMASASAIDEFAAVVREVRVVYQPTGDGQATAIELRRDPSRSKMNPAS